MLLLKCLLSPHLLLSCAFFPQTSFFRAHFSFFLLSRGSCINLSLHTLKNVVRRRRRIETEKKNPHVLKYFSPPPATEKRPRVLVSLQPHASTTHLFMEEEEEDSKRAGMRKTEAGRDIPLWLRMILHSACSMSELLLKRTLWAQGERNCTRNNKQQSKWVRKFCSNVLLICPLNLNIWCKNCLWHLSLLCCSQTL